MTCPRPHSSGCQTFAFWSSILTLRPPPISYAVTLIHDTINLWLNLILLWAHVPGLWPSQMFLSNVFSLSDETGCLRGLETPKCSGFLFPWRMQLFVMEKTLGIFQDGNCNSSPAPASVYKGLFFAILHVWEFLLLLMQRF